MAYPYIVLGIPETSSNEEIRKAYLAKIQANPPENAPEMFQMISEAYRDIDTDEKRAELKLFGKLRMHHDAGDCLELLPETELKRKKPGIDLWLKINHENR